MKLEREKFKKEFKVRKKSGSKKGKRFHKTREGKCLDKNLKSGKNRDPKKEKDSIKLEKGNVWKRI